MLGAANWPIAELLQPKIASLFNLPALTEVTGGRAPSIPNGGLGEVNAAFWFIVLAVGVFAEVGEITPLEKDQKLAGDLGFDPLGFWNKADAAGKLDFQEKELANGRLAVRARPESSARAERRGLISTPAPRRCSPSPSSWCSSSSPRSPSSASSASPSQTLGLWYPFLATGSGSRGWDGFSWGWKRSARGGGSDRTGVKYQ